MKTAINFTWRNPPTARFARYLVEQGGGRPNHLHAAYLQGFLADNSSRCGRRGVPRWATSARTSSA